MAVGEAGSDDLDEQGVDPTDPTTSPVGGGIPAFVNCDETIERLYTYLDGELTDARRTVIARHLDLCGPCVDAFGFEAELRKVIANRCKDRVPQALIERVALALRDEHAHQGD
ncbi:MAG: mycothiol system anti-sigma-R factor [Acidimicrobiales bacterium]